MILLDTHALLWWTQDSKKLSKKAKAVIEKEVSVHGLYVSAISFWEIALLIRKKRIKFTINLKTWVDNLLAIPAITSTPIDHNIAIRAITLKDFTHKDPADRLIVATALSLKTPLVSGDKKIRSYKHVRTIW